MTRQELRKVKETFLQVKEEAKEAYDKATEEARQTYFRTIDLPWRAYLKAKEEFKKGETEE